MMYSIIRGSLHIVKGDGSGESSFTLSKPANGMAEGTRLRLDFGMSPIAYCAKHSVPARMGSPTIVLSDAVIVGKWASTKAQPSFADIRIVELVEDSASLTKEGRPLTESRCFWSRFASVPNMCRHAAITQLHTLPASTVLLRLSGYCVVDLQSDRSWLLPSPHLPSEGCPPAGAIELLEAVDGPIPLGRVVSSFLPTLTFAQDGSFAPLFRGGWGAVEGKLSSSPTPALCSITSVTVNAFPRSTRLWIGQEAHCLFDDYEHGLEIAPVSDR